MRIDPAQTLSQPPLHPVHFVLVRGAVSRAGEVGAGGSPRIGIWPDVASEDTPPVEIADCCARDFGVVVIDPLQHGVGGKNAFPELEIAIPVFDDELGIHEEAAVPRVLLSADLGVIPTVGELPLEVIGISEGELGQAPG